MVMSVGHKELKWAAATQPRGAHLVAEHIVTTSNINTNTITTKHTSSVYRAHHQHHDHDHHHTPNEYVIIIIMICFSIANSPQHHHAFDQNHPITHLSLSPPSISLISLSFCQTNKKTKLFLNMLLFSCTSLTSIICRAELCKLCLDYLWTWLETERSGSYKWDRSHKCCNQRCNWANWSVERAHDDDKIDNEVIRQSLNKSHLVLEQSTLFWASKTQDPGNTIMSPMLFNWIWGKFTHRT